MAKVAVRFGCAKQSKTLERYLLFIWSQDLMSLFCGCFNNHLRLKWVNYTLTIFMILKQHYYHLDKIKKSAIELWAKDSYRYGVWICSCPWVYLPYVRFNELICPLLILWLFWQPLETFISITLSKATPLNVTWGFKLVVFIQWPKLQNPPEKLQNMNL